MPVSEMFWGDRYGQVRDPYGVLWGMKPAQALTLIANRIEEAGMKKITPFLWFNGKAEQAAEFYVSVFKSARIVDVMRSGEGLGDVDDVRDRRSALHRAQRRPRTLLLRLPSPSSSPAKRRRFDACGEAVAGGEKMQCGWVTDKYGLRWQIVPSILDDLLGDKDAAKSAGAMKAMLG